MQSQKNKNMLVEDLDVNSMEQLKVEPLIDMDDTFKVPLVQALSQPSFKSWPSLWETVTLRG